jgi:predicted nucleic acid-binding protein
MKRSSSLRPHYLDASALVKLVVDEEYSSRVRAHVETQSWRVCTSYCFVEALGALKLKKERGELSERAYTAASRRLIGTVRSSRIKILGDIPSSSVAFAEAERMVKAYNIDFLDAFQIISIKDSWHYLAAPSKPILITADNKLSKAATKEGIKSWYCRETRRPKE